MAGRRQEGPHVAAVTVRFDPEVKEKLEQIAHRRRLPTALLARIWIEEAIEREEGAAHKPQHDAPTPSD